MRSTGNLSMSLFLMVLDRNRSKAVDGILKRFSQHRHDGLVVVVPPPA